VKKIIQHFFYYHNKLYKLFLNSKDIHCKSQKESLNHISLAEFVATFDTKSSNKRKCNKIISWVSFNLHIIQKINIKNLLLFMPFHLLENKSKGFMERCLFQSKK
jgi:hypothetical protein